MRQRRFLPCETISVSREKDRTCYTTGTEKSNPQLKNRVVFVRVRCWCCHETPTAVQRTNATIIRLSTRILDRGRMIYPPEGAEQIGASPNQISTYLPPEFMHPGLFFFALFSKLFVLVAFSGSLHFLSEYFSSAAHDHCQRFATHHWQQD